MVLLSRFFAITGHLYPSFFSIRQDESIGTIFEKLRDKKLKKLRQKYFLDVLAHPRGLRLWLILAIFFKKIFNIFQNWYQSTRHGGSRKMRAMSDQLYRKT